MAQALQRDAVECAFTLIVAVQPDPAAPFVPVNDYNIIADPAEFAGALLKELARGLTFSQSPALPCARTRKQVRRTSFNRAEMLLPMPPRLC